MDEKLQALVSQLLNEGKSEEEIRDFIRQYKEENVYVQNCPLTFL